MWLFVNSLSKYFKRNRCVPNIALNLRCYNRDFFLHFRKNSRRKKPKFFGLQPKTRALFFQKNLLLLEIVSTRQFFFNKNLNILKLKKEILYVFSSQRWRKRKKIAQKIAFSFQYLHKKLIFSGNSSNLEKLKQLLGKTQENIQKLKQNEHQVLSCSQKKCKIKPPE